jgi:hypothetical protein
MPRRLERALAAFAIATGSVTLDIDVPNPEKFMGPIFVRDVKDRSTGCYVDSLMRKPDQRGEVAFTIKPPAGEGSFLFTVDAKGTLEPEVVECVRKILGGFYHYAEHPSFDKLNGRLRYEPKMVAAPDPPTEEVVRKMLARSYGDRVVKMTGFKLKSTAYDYSPPEVLRRYFYAVDLEFTVDGEESICKHWNTYKVFTQAHYENKYDGHSCESHSRKRGDRTSDSGELTFHIPYEPAMGRGWMLGDDEVHLVCGNGPCKAP